MTPKGVTLVTGLSFEMPKGGSLLLTGHNGAGKSSIFRCLGGLWNIVSPKQSAVACDSVDCFDRLLVVAGEWTTSHCPDHFLLFSIILLFSKNNYAAFMTIFDWFSIVFSSFSIVITQDYRGSGGVCHGQRVSDFYHSFIHSFTHLLFICSFR